MANGAKITDDHVFDLMEAIAVADLPFFDEPEITYYQVPGDESYYAPNDKVLQRHEIVDKVTGRWVGGPGEDQKWEETSRKSGVPSPKQRGLVPLMPTSPLDLALETLYSAVGEAGGLGAELGVGLGLGVGIKGGKYAIGLGKGLQEGAGWADDILGYEYSKHQFRKAFGRMKEDPMFGHIDFPKVSTFEKPGSPYTSGSGRRYGAYYNPGRGSEMFDEMFPSGSKGWYAKANPETGYVPSMKTEWRGGTEHMGKVSGKEKPFTFRTRPLSKSYRKGLSESFTRHEGRHFMQDYPMTPTVEHSVWDDLVAGRPVYNVSKMYGGGGTNYKTIIDVPVPKAINQIAKKGELPSDQWRGNAMGKYAGFRQGKVNKATGDLEDPTWYSYSGPIEVEARLEELYSHRGIGGEWKELRKIGYEDKEIVDMLDDYVEARKLIYGPKPGGGWKVDLDEFVWKKDLGQKQSGSSELEKTIIGLFPSKLFEP